MHQCLSRGGNAYFERNSNHLEVFMISMATRYPAKAFSLFLFKGILHAGFMERYITDVSHEHNSSQN